MRARGGRAAAGALAVLATLVVPTGWAAGGAAGATPGPVATPVKAPFSGHGSIDEAYELGAVPGTHLVLYDAAGRAVGKGVADRYGSLIVPSLRPGPGYRFGAVTGGTVQKSAPFKVLSVDDTPPESFYADQHLHVGLNYITMRDGITLAATVRLPPGKTLADGPFPTVLEYSGYAIAAPGNLLSSILNPSAGSSNPLLPDSATAVGSVITPLLGFATVSLQMRGTGCSGGALDLFGLPTIYDGYDAVQIAAAQPWVLGHKVGLVGISFSGISQLFVAGTRPPGLAAIAPMSPTNDLYATGYPGGIFNSGFAASWVAQRVADAEPAPAGGQPYARALIEAGDKQCLANQDLRLQTENIEKLLADNDHRTPSIFAVRSPEAWARRIDVPVFMVGALQDEQTGPQWPDLIDALSGDRHVWVTMLNGTHIDSLGPGSITRWIEFLDLFVAHRLPHAPSLVLDLSGALYRQVADAPAEPLPKLRFTDAPSVAAATARFEHDPRVRVLFDNGGSAAEPGALDPLWEADFGSWPPARAVPTTLTLGAGGALGAARAGASSVSWRPDPSARPATDLAASANVWSRAPPYDWTPVTGTEGVGFVSAPLRRTTVVVGPASVNLWLRSSAPDTDLQVTVSDVRPDGQEMYVTSGYLRASDRALAPARSTVLEPRPTYLAATARPLPAGRYSLVRVPVDPIAYAFRTGSRIRLTISAPGGDRPEWAFATYRTRGRVTDTIALGGAHPSTVVLPVVPGVVPGDAQPPCPSSRGEPCRAYVPAGNGG